MQTAQTTHPETQNEPTKPTTEPTTQLASPGSQPVSLPSSRLPSSVPSTETQNEPTEPANESASTPPLSHFSTFSPSHSPSPNEPTPQPTEKPPISAAKLAANRANARKSTGPRTPAGKRRSRMNALKHGLLAWATILYDDKNDHPTEMAPLLADLTDALQPRDRYEELLVERIACTHWRLRRLYRYEVDAVAESRMRSNLPWAQVSRGLIGITQDPAPAQLPGADHFDRILRYEAVIQRELRHLDQEVLRLKQLRLKERELRLKELEHSMEADDNNSSRPASDRVPSSVFPLPSESTGRQTNPPTRKREPAPAATDHRTNDPTTDEGPLTTDSSSCPRQTNPPTTDTPPVPDAAPDPLAKALEMVAAGFRNLRIPTPTPASEHAPATTGERTKDPTTDEGQLSTDSSPRPRQTNPPIPDAELAPATTDNRTNDPTTDKGPRTTDQCRPKTIWNNHIRFMGP